MVSGLLAVISIYFIFSPIINIEQFVLMDGLFIVAILVIIAVLTAEILITGRGDSARYYYNKVINSILKSDKG